MHARGGGGGGGGESLSAKVARTGLWSLVPACSTERSSVCRTLPLRAGIERQSTRSVQLGTRFGS